MNRASGSTCSRSPGRQKKRHESSKPSGAPATPLDHLRQARERQEVRERTVGLLDLASSSILPRSAASTIGIGSAGAVSSLNPLGAALAGEGVPEEVDPSRRSWSAASRTASRSSLRRSGPRRSRCRARSARRRRPRAPPPPGRAAPARAGRRRRPRCRAASSRSRPRQRQRREPVGAVGLAAPEVGVAGRLGAPHQLLAGRRAAVTGSGNVSPQRVTAGAPYANRVAAWISRVYGDRRSSAPQRAWC